MIPLTPAQELRRQVPVKPARTDHCDDDAPDSPDGNASEPAGLWDASHPPPDPPPRGSDRAQLRRRQISHDIHHELGTIMLLASLLSTAADVGESSRHRARLILGETRWLDQLQLAYEAASEQEVEPWPEPPSSTRLDLVASEIVEAVRTTTMTRIQVDGEAASARIDRLTFWRALRNVVDNAIRAAGPEGHVTVAVSDHDGWAVTQVDDDGPGFGSIPPGRAALGLGIVQQILATVGGLLEIRRGALGGCCVRLQIPAAPSDEDRSA